MHSNAWTKIRLLKNSPNKVRTSKKGKWIVKLDYLTVNAGFPYESSSVRWSELTVAKYIHVYIKV